ncbi:HFL313Cp [Eremothecium sinecaudum]|uniref:HFL313Cp n=1 Tax=Eremothecium sinecaudum TaxID=45286 RepID=A0A120K2H4_9SACH|nr:HFL313Cp [Eremothecium sinecaudum]AMD21543.1 HFL313Cp [Eremothecium sinecaudum]
MPISSKGERFLKLGAAATVLIITLWVFFKGADLTDTTKDVWIPSDTVKGSTLRYHLAPSSPRKYKEREKATFVTLARNGDLYSLLPAILNMEDRFNKKFQYDWVFLNDEEFSDEFKRVTSALVSGEAKYGLVPESQWSFPSWIDQERAAEVRKEMQEQRVIYGDSITYRYMCRYESGFFYRHPLLMDYDWYWRVEPDVKFYCDIDYDVFKFMRQNGKKYGFAISIHEYELTVKTLWDSVTKFLKEYPQYLHPNNMLNFISDDEGSSYNMCHFWSNFEVGSLDFWRGEAYSKFFDFLDHEGGFFYERWGDAPVHSIAAALFLDRNEIHHFNDIGYYHPPFTQCPIEEKVRKGRNCACDPRTDFTWKSFSCTHKYYLANDMVKPEEWYKYSQ